MMWLDLLQWPAMALTIAASALITSTEEKQKNWGFWLFIASNLLWVAWGWSSQAYALIAMQFCLAAMNVWGAMKTQPDMGNAGARNPAPQSGASPGLPAVKNNVSAALDLSVAGEEDPGAAIDLMT